MHRNANAPSAARIHASGWFVVARRCRSPFLQHPIQRLLNANNASGCGWTGRQSLVYSPCEDSQVRYSFPVVLIYAIHEVVKVVRRRMEVLEAGCRAGTS